MLNQIFFLIFQISFLTDFEKKGGSKFDYNFYVDMLPQNY